MRMGQPITEEKKTLTHNQETVSSNQKNEKQEISTRLTRKVLMGQQNIIFVKC